MCSQSGFTLVEMLIVLAILGILVGIVAMEVNGLTISARDRAVIQESEIVQRAIDTYNTQNVPVAIEPTIVARPNLARIMVTDTNAVGDVPFLMYLSRDTKFYYAWPEGGEPLTVSLTGP